MDTRYWRGALVCPTMGGMRVPARPIPGRRTVVTAGVVASVLLLPLLLAWALIGRAPTVTVREARAQLADPGARLVVVRGAPPAMVPGAEIWPFEQILQVRQQEDVPAALRGRRLLLLCPSGIRSARAALHLQHVGVGSVFNVRGGDQAWRTESDENEPTFRASSPAEQFAVVFGFFGVKAVYSLLAAALAFLLGRERAGDLVALRWGLVAFFVGEAFCFVNAMFFRDRSLFLEHLHTLGMVASLALAAYALLEGLDRRVVHFSDDGRCALVGVCSTCVKSGGPPCGLRRTLLVATTGLMLLAALPLSAPLQRAGYSTKLFGFPYGYGHPVLHQLFEIRFLPGLAVLLLLAGGVVVLGAERRTGPISRVLISAALGVLAFSYFRMTLVAVFAEAQGWFVFWEELSELVFIAALGAIVLAFRLSSLSNSLTRALFAMVKRP